MPWTIPGPWSELRADHFVPIFMSDLACAINERQEALNASLTTWGTAAGTKTYPAPADFDGYPFEYYGDNLSLFTKGLAEVLSAGDGAYAPPDSYPMFSGGFFSWCKPTLVYDDVYHLWHYDNWETAGGTFDVVVSDYLSETIGKTSFSGPLRVQNATRWEELRLAIEGLRYLRAPIYYLSGQYSQRSSFREPDWETAWSSMWSATPSVSVTFDGYTASRAGQSIRMRSYYWGEGDGHVYQIPQFELYVGHWAGCIYDAPIVRAHRFMTYSSFVGLTDNPGSALSSDPLARALTFRVSGLTEFDDAVNLPTSRIVYPDGEYVFLGEGTATIPYGTKELTTEFREYGGGALNHSSNPFAEYTPPGPPDGPNVYYHWLSGRYFVEAIIDTAGCWTYG